jgi:hypothetical protein
MTGTSSIDHARRLALSRRHARWGSAAVCLLVLSAASVARAQESTATPADPPSSADSLPGSPRPDGPSLSPEAPPTPPAPGGRAPSFGAPSDPDAWAFRVSGRISGWGQAGLGRKPLGSRLVLHTPPLIVGRSPFYTGPDGTLNFQ